MLTKRYPKLNHVFDDVLAWNNQLWQSFDEMVGSAGNTPMLLHPLVNRKDVDSKIVYAIDMPGISKDQVSVVQDGDYLKIEANRLDQNVESKFATNFKISPKAKLETLDASIQNGVLTISFEAKTDEELHPEPKRIEIKSSEPEHGS